MPEIILPESNLLSRQREIQKLLIPLRKDFRNVPCFYRSYYVKESKLLFWGVNDGNPYDKDIGRWRISTIKNIFSVNYQEHWIVIDEKRNYKLIKIILHIYKKDEIYPTEDKLYICLHCDPIDKFLYKESPHLHIKEAEDPIPNAHIALNISDIQKNVLNSIGTLTNAFKNNILMIKKEILERFN